MRLNIDVIQREMENLKELRNVNLLDVVDHLSDGSYRLKANIFPSSGAVYAFWWTGSSEHFLAGDVNRIMRFKGPNGRNVDVEFSDDWINQIHVDGKIPLYVGKTADSLHKRLSLHLQLKTKRGLSLGEKALSEERKTTSNQVRDGSLEFIGEDHVEHTAKDETLKLSIGKAFDIVFEYSEVDRKKAAGFEHYTYECIIRNHKNTEAEISFEPYVWGIWEMVKSSHEFIKKTATQLEYRLSVPADSEVLVRFEYKIDRRTEVIVKK